jgi:hypothetical protein
MKRFGAAIGLLLVSLHATAPPAPPVPQRFLGLFQELRATAAQPPTSRQRVSFALSDAELNEYMRYALHSTTRPGLDSVTVKIFPHNYVSTFAVVDFDAVERWKPGTIPGVLRPVLYGKQSIWVDYQFAAANSKLTFSVEKAYYGKLRLPAFFVQRMIQIVGARQPEHYDTSKPLPLPFGLRTVWTENQIVKGSN